jgi:hypothetical protein
MDFYELGEWRAIAIQAAQWGADQELEACLRYLDAKGHHPTVLNALRAARRPKPPSLKEQALAELDDAVMRGDCITVSDALPTIRRAIEALPND